MSIIEKKVKKVIEAEIKKHEGNRQLEKLTDFYTAMKGKGIIIPQKYNIPPLDTVGKRRYQSIDKEK